MDFLDELQALSARAARQADRLSAEEATKHGLAFRMPSTFRTLALCSILLGCGSNQPPDGGSARSSAKRPIIDMHMHAFTFKEFGTSVNGDLPPVPTTGKPAEAKTDDDILRLTLAAMDRYNIRLGVLSGRLETVYAWKARAPGRFLAGIEFGGRPAGDTTAHDPTPSLSYLRREVAAGRLQVLGEITSPYEGIDYDGPELAPYFALAAELKLPVGVHTGLTFPDAVHTCCPRYRIERGNPVHLDEVLARNPGLRLYLMHMGDIWQESTLAILHMYPQVYVDVGAMSFGAIPRAQFYSMLQGLIAAGFGKRIMFGTDQMVWPELIGTAVEAIESAPFLSEEQKQDIFYNNAARFLGLPDLPVAAKHQTALRGNSGAG